MPVIDRLYLTTTLESGGIVEPAKISQITLALAAAAMTAMGVMPGTAAATETASCSLDAHCYGVAAWGDGAAPATYGSYGTLNIGACLYSPATGDDFTDEEMWQGTNDDPNGRNRVEEGATMGARAPTLTGRYWFWAD